MSIHTGIPFLDLITPHLELETELTDVFRKALRTAGFIGGPMVEEFEDAFASFCDTKYAVGVNSGTDALRFALIACGVRSGEVVVTVPNTFIATTEAISQAGAFPEFVDIDERTYNLDPAKLQEYLDNQCTVDASGQLISRKSGRPVTAVIPVHLYGQTAEMDPILDLSDRYGLIVVEDACQAHGAEYFSRKQNRWMKAGSMGRAAAFSFYPGKNLGACGEAGAATTNDPDIAQKIKMLRDHGQGRKYYHTIEGYNGRLDTIQAGILQTKLRHVSDWNEARRQVADRYRQLLSSLSESVTLPYEAPWSRAVYHLFVIQTANRDQMRSQLAEARIDTGIHYPIPLHLQEAYRGLGYKKGDFPISEQVASEGLSLPMFPTLSVQDQQRVADVIANFVSLTAV